jgi:hypothetical protein
VGVCLDEWVWLSVSDCVWVSVWLCVVLCV